MHLAGTLKRTRNFAAVHRHSVTIPYVGVDVKPEDERIHASQNCTACFKASTSSFTAA